MNRSRTPARIPAVLAALVAALAVAQGARAELIPSSPPVITPNGSGGWTFPYDLKVLGTSQVQVGDYAVFYDIQGYIAGTASAPAGWTATTPATGPTPVSISPTDTALPNIVYTYTGGGVISPGGTTVSIAGFSYQSTFGDTTTADFASQTHLDPDVKHPTGRKVGNITQVDVPAPGGNNDSPEPATLLLVGLGAPLAGAFALLRRFKAVLPV